MRLKCKVFLLFIAVLLLFTACGRKDANETNNDAKDSVTPKEFTEFNIDKGYIINQVSTTADNHYAYISAMKEHIQDINDIALFVCENTKGKWSDPLRITFNNEIIPYSAVINSDGSTLYVTGIKPDIAKAKGPSAPRDVYKVDIAYNEVKNISQIELDNKNYYNDVIGNGINNQICIVATSEDGKTSQPLVCKEEDGKLVSDTYEMDNVKQMNYLFLSEKQALTAILDESSKKVKVGTADISNNKFINFKELNNLKDFLEDLEIISANISGDFKTLYFISKDYGLYTLNVSDIYKKINPIPASVNSGALYNKFDTSDFELKLRNKTDESKKQGVYYEIFVRSFADSNGDGIGDLNGVTEKLDYLKELGIEGIWLMPINSSPSYHGYDVTDYNSINKDYGTEEDFKKLLDEAHARGIKVITDFVINHTSNQHPWFISALEGDDSPYRNYYRWVVKEDTVDYSASDKSPWDSPVWFKVGNAYYYSLFYGDMPDLNYNNPKVREEIKNAAGKWLKMGVDGFRLDACIHIYGDNEFKQMDSQTDANIQWWNEFASYCETINPEVYLVGEAWDKSNIFAEYAQPFDTKFDFTFEQNMIYAIQNGVAITQDAEDLASNLQTIIGEYAKYDKKYLDGVFATNHDQNRLMSQVQSSEKAELAAAIYLTLSGNPFIYYGEELGMYGEGDDQYKRTPFIWSKDGSDMDATWIDNSQNADVKPLKDQINDKNSMYTFYKNMLALRKDHEALTSGSYNAVTFENKSLLAYERNTDNEKLLVIHNLSDKKVNVDLSNYKVGQMVFKHAENTALNNNSAIIGAYGTIIIDITE